MPATITFMMPGQPEQHFFASIIKAQEFFDNLEPNKEVEVFVRVPPEEVPLGEDHYRLWLHPDNRVQFFGMPARLTDAIAGRFGFQVLEALKSIDPELLHGSSFGSSMRVKLNPGSKEPMYFFIPDGLQHDFVGKPKENESLCPTFVLEVANEHESLFTLLKRA